MALLALACTFIGLALALGGLLRWALEYMTTSPSRPWTTALMTLGLWGIVLGKLIPILDSPSWPWGITIGGGLALAHLALLLLGSPWWTPGTTSHRALPGPHWFNLCALVLAALALASTALVAH